MNTQQFFKGLLLAIIGVIVTLFTTTPIDYLLLGVTAFCVALDYAGKNLIPWLHSDSPAGSLSLINIVSGLLIALGAVILESVGTFLVTGAILWPVVWKIVVYTTGTYLITTFFAPPYSKEKKRAFASKRYISRYVKGTAVLGLFLFFAIESYGQKLPKFNYLISPIPENLFKSNDAGQRILERNKVTLFKLNGVINTGALTYNTETKSFEPDAWIGTGPVFSFRQYIDDGSGNAIEKFGIGVGALIGTSLTDINLKQLRTVLNFEIGKLFSIGYGFSAITDTPNKRHSLLFNTRFDF